MSVWDEVVGQPRVVEQLQRAARDNEPTHAWLFTGPPGSGRSTAARALAAALAGRTALVIAHRLSTIRAADEILVVEDNFVVADALRGVTLAQMLAPPPPAAVPVRMPRGKAIPAALANN